ncbi:MAG: hypothetical protein Q7U75_12110 [Desulfobacterales bacterium]|nr:hypothetical protein [Desulfobacterales bacterium]
MASEEPYRVFSTDENGDEHEHWVGPHLHSEAAFQEHADRLNAWTHRMMEEACGGGEMSPEWYAGRTPNSHYVVSFRIA